MTIFEIVISVIGVVLFVYLYCSARTSKNRYEELKNRFYVKSVDCGVYEERGYISFTGSRIKIDCFTNQELYDNLANSMIAARSSTISVVNDKLNNWYNSTGKIYFDLNNCNKALETLQPVIKYLELKKKIEADATTKENLKKELADLKKQVNDLLK
jgi:hypothetical protein